MSSIPAFTGRHDKQAGMVAIMVTLILMIVISLIVLGFAQISRRNQRQALDRQLGTQAFYAAETGVNDAAKLIKTAIQSGAAVAPKTDCTPNSGAFYTTLTPVLSATDKVEYTCLLVDPTPSTLVYSNIGTRGTVIPLNTTGNPISSLTLTWQSKDNSATPANNCPTTTTSAFTNTATWTSSGCGYGVLRYDLVPASTPIFLTGNASVTMTSFVVPLRPGSAGASPNPISYPAYPAAIGGMNSRLSVVCSNTNCSLTINGLGRNQYQMRVMSLYKNVSLQISAADSSGVPILLRGAQAVVDVTGKAQDVLRRIQVRLPLGSSTNQNGDYAIQSTEALCKRFSVMTGLFDNNADDVVPSVVNSPTSAANVLCRP